MSHRSRCGFVRAASLALAAALTLASCSQASREAIGVPECAPLLDVDLAVSPDKTQAVKSCVTALVQAEPADQDQFAKTYASAYPQTIPASRFDEFVPSLAEAAAQIFEAIAIRSEIRAEPDQAEETMQRMIDDARSGSNHQAETILMHSLGTAAFYRGDVEQARSRSERALALAGEHQMIGFAPHIRSGLGAIAAREKDVSGALEQYRASFDIIPSLNHMGRKLLCRNTSIIASDKATLSDQALDDLIDGAEAEGQPEYASCLMLAKSLRARVRYDTDEMRDVLLTILDRTEQGELSSFKPEIVYALGQHAYLVGDFAGALESYEEVIDLYRSEGDLTGETTATNSIANVLADIGDYERAIGMYERALDLWEQSRLTSASRTSTFHANIGWALAMQEDHAAALTRYKVAYDTLREEPKHPLNGFLNYHYAKSLHAQGRTQEALKMAQSAVPVTLERRNPLEAAAMLSWMSGVHLERNETVEADATLSQAQAIIEREDVDPTSLSGDSSYRYWEADFNSNMATLLGRMGRADEALGYAQRALELGNTRFESEKLEAAANTELKFDLWNNEQALSLSQREAEVRQLRLERANGFVVAGAVLALLALLAAFFAYRSYRMQTRLVAVKNTFLHETQHRAGNNLLLLSSLLRIGSRQIGKGTDAATLAKSTSDRARTMALIHQHLYRSDSAGDIDAAAFFDDLLDLMRKSMGREEVELTGHFEQLDIPVDALTPLGLITCEMVTNAYKHAFGPEGGTIEVELKQDAGQKVLEVRDNGRGLQEPARKDDNGFHGVELLNDLVDQIGGRIDQAESERGTHWRVTF
ncbi:tetratricopeptide repeat-containing sensor histidine kinase [Erythrobacter rubeus]|uniref:histidine kinase n=1 Tax=Erythrobacter rubeus TaxID=2760803 RepID=A0ABR8KWM2_9SPHN|nr:tetratricopeptide repeat protein [Erythrobacter rubeus]MBD2842824.1 tetratricopeptide repeat protein [Erythrobacter rubeus]